jgi:hypothetical protein
MVHDPLKDKENVAKIISKKAEFCIAFQTFQEARDWAMMIKQDQQLTGHRTKIENRRRIR